MKTEEDIYEAQIDYSKHVDIQIIIQNISFSNCHLVAKALIDSDPTAANGLLGELLGWKERGKL